MSTKYHSITLLFFILLSYSFSVFSQEILIVDAIRKTSVEGVHVYNQNRNFTTTSNNTGFILLDSELPTSDTLYFQHLSYEIDSYTITDLEKMNYQVELMPEESALPEIVVSVGKMAEKLDEVTNKVDIIEAAQVAFNNPQNAADLLQSTGNVYVQKSQMGGGSPVIRGFEANKVLIVVDGVRMNNAIYRGGHLQNVITIDNNVLERTEVVFGPGSVIYGSDALGGVMHFITKNPRLASKADKSLIVSGSTMARYASANSEQSLHADLSIGGRKFGSLTSISYSNFGDLNIGRVRANTKDYEGWGTRPFYVATFNGVDSLVANDNIHRLRFTAYKQADVLQKFYYQLNRNINFKLNFQYSTSSNIPRFDRLNDASGEGLKFAEWNYGPQRRLLTSLSSTIKQPNALFNQLSLVAAFQKIDEDRINRKFGNSSRTRREEDVQVYTFNADFLKTFNSQHQLQYGIEATHNEVQSSAYNENFLTETLLDTPTSTRYPDGGSNMSTLAAYLRHKWKVSPQFILTSGFRYSYTHLAASFVDTSFFSLPYTSTRDAANALTGSLGIVYKPVYTTKLSATFSTGFRSPNIDDATKVFDPTDEIVVVPNVGIQPEYAYNAELGIEQKFGNFLKMRGDVYFNYLTNLIKRSPFLLNGQDSLIYDGELKAVYANINAGKAYVTGFTFSALATLNSSISLEKKLNYTIGKDLTNDVPLGHIPPLFGQFSARYTSKNKLLESAIILRYNAWKHIDDYSPTSEDKSDEATADGTPSWYVLNWQTTYQLPKNLQLNFALENIFDRHYKPFASGISGAGRNFVLSARVNF